MRKTKQLIVAMLLIFTLVLGSTASFADSKESKSNNGRFKDVTDSFWARQAIELMVNHGIINGYNDGSFKPDASVSRAEFAKMMVLTLNLDLIKPSSPFFVDVKKSDWHYSYIETSRLYMTGFSSVSGHMFRPDWFAVREDMAVAIVKGLGLNPDKTDLSVLNKYTDQGDISPNLRKYVATAINEGIMVGNDLKFNPNASISRAETATLLARLIQEEKVVYDKDTKVTYDNTNNITALTPVLTHMVLSNSVKLMWTPVASKNFSYYKVVLSKTDSTPSYPDNGYVTYITDVNKTFFEVKEDQVYQGSDMKVVDDETYYMAVTAVYTDGKYTSNVIQVKVPDKD